MEDVYYVSSSLAFFFPKKKYIYIYIYMCVCVCVCIKDLKEKSIILKSKK